VVGDLVLWSSDAAKQNAGTLFLDEVGSLPPKVMAGLLRLLSSYDVVPLGYHGRGIRTYCRIIAATNETRVLDAISKGTLQPGPLPESSFRADLYYRLNGAVLHLSALKDREALRVQADQMRQSVHKLQQQSEHMQQAYVQRELERGMQILRDLLRRLTHLAYVVADLTQSACIRSDDVEDRTGDRDSIFGASTFYLECSNRDEFDIATAQFLGRLEVLADALSNPSLLLEWPQPELELLRTYLIAMRDRAKLVCDLRDRVPREAIAIFPFSDLERLQRVLDNVISQIETWVNPV
jgi:hypothetical protein